MTVLLQLDVPPHNAQVALVDATWQDYPQWETGEEQVVFRAPSLIAPDKPPYPGFAVATQADIGPDGPRKVRIEVWSGEEPGGLHCVHQSVLYVGSAGVLVGNDQSGSMTKLTLARGQYALRILVDAEAPHAVSRVVFASASRTWTSAQTPPVRSTKDQRPRTAAIISQTMCRTSAGGEASHISRRITHRRDSVRPRPKSRPHVYASG